MLSMDIERLRESIQPEDILTEREFETLQRARADQIMCPWECDRPVRGSFYFFVHDGIQHKGVRLQCGRCGFDEQ